MLVMLALIGLIIIIFVATIFLFQRKIDFLTQHIIDLKETEQNVVAPGMNMIQSATKKASQIISAAEMEAIKIPTETRMESNLMEEQLNQKLNQHLEKFNLSVEATFKHFQDNLVLSMSQDKKKHDEFLENLAKRSLDFESQIQSGIKTKVEELLIGFEQKMTDFFTGAQQKSMDEVNLEISSARQLIDTYKSEQLKLVDENIIAILERTLNLVLKERLTLKDQLDLVYEALEKAKVEKFLV